MKRAAYVLSVLDPAWGWRDTETFASAVQAGRYAERMNLEVGKDARVIRVTREVVSPASADYFA